MKALEIVYGWFVTVSALTVFSFVVWTFLAFIHKIVTRVFVKYIER